MTTIYLVRHGQASFGKSNYDELSQNGEAQATLLGRYFKDILKKRIENTERTEPPFKIAIYIQLLSYLAPLFFAVALKSTQRWVKNEAERKEAANIKLKSELQHLHYQLQPHFFFNSAARLASSASSRSIPVIRHTPLPLRPLV